MKNVIQAGCGAVLLWAATSQAVFATQMFSIGDVFIGTYTGSESGCLLPPASGSFGGPISIIITDAAIGGFFTATADVTDSGDGGTTSYSVSGSFIDNTGGLSLGANGTNSDGGFENYSGSGQLTGNALSINASGSESGGADCSFLSVSISASRSGDIAIATPESTGAGVTTPKTVRDQPVLIAGAINARANAAIPGTPGGASPTGHGFLLQNASGKAAGDTAAAFGVWASYSRSDFENTFAPTAYDGDTNTFLGGIDFNPTANSVLGVALSFEDTDIDTTFNGGVQETDGFTIAPYFGTRISDSMNADVSIGFSSLNIDQFRTVVGTGARVSSSPDADRWFLAGNLNGFWVVDNWILNSRLGFLYANQVIDAFTEDDGTTVAEAEFDLMQLNFGGGAAYSMDEFEPYVNATYGHDFAATTVVVPGSVAQPANDTDDILLGIGVRYFGKGGLSGTVEWSTRVSRQDFDEDTFTLSIRKDY